MFGSATTVTADSPVEHLLYASSGRKWVNVDIELESGCGIVPYSYKEKAAVAALQWSVGLELFLLANDPWRVVLSTDHPNGGTFLSYPELIRLLMDRGYRDDRLKAVNQKLLVGSALLDGLAREYTLGEAFTMRVARLVITGRTAKWAREAATKLTGFATSVIGCKCEAGIERELTPAETPDGRPGISVLFLTMDKASLPEQLIVRVGQTVLTCPTTACFDGLPDAPDRLAVGKALRVFGDGFQASKVIGGKRYWRLPVMEGEFLIEETFGMLKGVGGGNFLILADDADAALAAAEAAVDAMTSLPGVILPFPGGVVRSGSKVGSTRYKNMVATTNDPFDPTLRASTQSQLPEGVNSVLEIVLDGTDAPSIEAAMRTGIPAACRRGVNTITAANFGGKLGPHHFHLRKILA